MTAVSDAIASVAGGATGGPVGAVAQALAAALAGFLTPQGQELVKIATTLHGLSDAQQSAIAAALAGKPEQPPDKVTP